MNSVKFRGAETGFAAAELPEPDRVTVLAGFDGDSPLEAHTILFTSESITISDEFNHRVLCFYTGGNLKWTAGGQDESGASSFYPRGLAATVNSLWVCDPLNHRILVLDKDSGKVVSRVEALTELHEPVDLEIQPQGNILLANRRNHCLLVLDRTGNLIEQWGGRGSEVGNTRSLRDYLNPLPATGRGLTRQFELSFPNQISLNGGLLWVADNKSVTAYGSLSQKVFEVRTGPGVCLRGLAAFGSSAVYLDEVTRDLNYLDLDGNRTKLVYGAEPFCGCSLGTGDEIAALQGNRLLHWKQENIREIARGIPKKRVAFSSRKTELKKIAALGDPARALKLAVSLFKKHPADEELAKTLLRLSGISRWDKGSSQSICDYALSNIVEAVAYAERNLDGVFKSGLKPVAPPKPSLPHHEFLPGISSLVSTRYLDRAAGDLVRGLYDSLRRSWFWLYTVIIGDYSSRDGSTRPDGKRYADLVNRVGPTLLDTAAAAARSRRRSLRRVVEVTGRLATSLSAGDSAELVEFGSLYTIASQVLDQCSAMLDKLLAHAEPALPVSESGLPDLLRRRADFPVGIRNLIAYSHLEVSPRHHDPEDETLDEAQRGAVEEYADLVVEMAGAREVYLAGKSSAQDNFIHYLKLSWKYLDFVEKLVEEHGLLLPVLWVKTPEMAAELLARIGFPDKAEQLPESAEEEAESAPPPAELISGMREEIVGFSEGRLSAESFSGKLLSLCRDYPARVVDVVARLWALVEPERYLELTILADLPFENNPEWTKQRVRLFCLFAAYVLAAGRAGKAKELEAKARKIAPDPGTVPSEIGMRLARISCHREAIPFLREALAQRRSPTYGVLLRRSLNGDGETEEAERIWWKICGGFDLSGRERALILDPRNWQDLKAIRHHLLEHWHTLRDDDDGEMRHTLAMMRDNGCAPDAAELLVPLIRRNPHQADWLLMRSRCLFLTGRYDEAYEIAEEHDRKFGPSIESMTLKKFVHWYRGDLQAACDAGRLSVELGRDPDLEAVFLARTALWERDFKRAETVLGSITDSSPAAMPRENLIGEMLLWKFRLEDSFKALIEVELQQTGNIQSAVVRALIRLRQGRLDEAEGIIRQSNAIGQRHVVFDLLNGVILLEQGRIENGRELLRSALWREPWNLYAPLAALRYGKSFQDTPPNPADDVFVGAFEERYAALPSPGILKAMSSAVDAPGAAADSLPEARRGPAWNYVFCALARGELYLLAQRYADAVEALEPVRGYLGLEDTDLAYAEAALGAGDRGEAVAAIETLRDQISGNDRLININRELAGT